jgi:hypothetical protein
VNGIQIYYEVHGRHDDTPLVLLRGGGSTIDSSFGRIIPFLARTRRVIALEEQGTDALQIAMSRCRSSVPPTTSPGCFGTSESRKPTSWASATARRCVSAVSASSNPKQLFRPDEDAGP